MSISNLQPERRQLTVMFCDLADFTSLSEELDPEDLREVVLAYQEACESIIRNYNGYIAQFLGDGILVYFGFPSARENDAQRAVKAGLRIIQSIRDLSLPERMNHNGLQVRIGIHTGQVVVGQMGGEEKTERIAVGTVPNIAARIQQAAGNNEILITSSTQNLIQGHFDCETFGQYPLKGLSTPITLYKVLRERKLATRFDLVLSKGLTPFVGRERELNLLHDKWNLVKEGAGQVVLVRGEAGIGKSRLVHEFKNRISNETFNTQTYQCLPEYQNSAFYPIIKFYEDHLDLGGNEADEDKIKKLEAFVEKKKFSFTESVPLLASLLSINLSERYPALQYSPAKQKEKTIELLVSLVSQDAEEKPILLVIEDVHWIDPSTLEFLNSLVGKVRDRNILLLITYRPEFVRNWEDYTFSALVELCALNADEVEGIVNKIRDEQGFFKEIVREVIKRSDGVPLYAEELTKTILETGGYGANPKYTNIPLSLSDLLMERLDRLGRAKEVAQIGSIIGGAFSSKILCFFESEEEAVIKGIRALLDAGLLIEINDAEEKKYDFKHMMIKEAAYNSMLRTRRMMLHKEYGEILEEKFPKVIETNPEVVAYHYTEAEMPGRAIPYWISAGKKAQLRYALDEAISHINKGLELVKRLPEDNQVIEQELNLQLTLGAVWLVKTGFTGPEIGKAFFRAYELSKKLENVLLRFQALAALTYHYIFVDITMYRQLMDEMREIVGSTNNQDILAPYFVLKGTFLTWDGELELSLEFIDKANSLYSSSRDNMLIHADSYIVTIGYKSAIFCINGYPDRAKKYYYDYRIISDNGTSQIWFLFHEMFLHHLINDHELTRRLSEELIELSMSYGDLYCICAGKILRGWALFQEGNLVDGISDMKNNIDILKKLGLKLIVPHYIGLLAEAYLKIDNPKEASDCLDEQIDFMYKENLLFHEPEFLRIKGKILLALDNMKEAEEYYQRSITAAQRMKAKLWEIRTVNDYCRLMMKQGRHKEAKEMLSETYNWFTEGFDTKDLIEAKVLLEE